MGEEADREASAYAQATLGVATHSPPRLTLVPSRYAALVAESRQAIAEECPPPVTAPIEIVETTGPVEPSRDPRATPRFARADHLRLTFGLCFLTAGALLGLRRRQRRPWSRS